MSEPASSNSGISEFQKDGISSIDDLKKLGLVRDTANLRFNDLNKIAPNPGYYLVCGMHLTEEKCNRQIKQLYHDKIMSYKFYDPVNKYYYVYLMVKDSEELANKEMYRLQDLVPQVWVRNIK